MNKLFINIYERIKTKRLLFSIGLLTFVSGCIFLATQIKFNEDITKILPKNDDNLITAKVLKQLNFSDKIIVMINTEEDKNIPQLPYIADTLLHLLQQDSSYYKKIQGRVQNQAINTVFNFVYQHLPLFLDHSDYQEIALNLSNDSIQKHIKDDYQTLISPTGIVARDFILKDPLGWSFMSLKKLRKTGIAKEFIINNGYLASKDSSTLLLFITPTYSGTDTKHNAAFVNNLYAYQDSINKTFNGVGKISYFGAPFIAVANAKQIKSDIQHTVIYSLIVLAFILIFFYRRLFIPIILFIPAACAVSIALAFLSLLNHDISAISIGIGAILLGITVDYPLHIITHYRENKDIHHLYHSITKPIMASSLTTAISFLCLIFVHSEVLIDLGIFASISVFFSAVFSLLIIPHLYIPRTTIRKTFVDKFAAHDFHKNKILIGVTIVAVLFGLFTFSRVKFNKDISKLNYVPQNMVQSEHQLNQLGSINAKSIYVSVYGSNKDSVLQRNHQLSQQLEQLKQKGKIQNYTSVGKYLLSLSAQTEKIKKWNKFWNHQSRRDTTYARVQKAASKLGFKTNAFKNLQTLLHKEYSPIPLSTYREFPPIDLDEYLAENNSFITLSSIIKTDSTHRAEVIKILQQPNVIPIDRKQLNETFLGQMKNDFRSLINYSFIAVFLVLILFFRRIELAIVSIIPITLTGLVTAGLVYILGLEFNIFSTIVTTLILGLGVDFSIFITNGLQKEETTGKNELKTYRTSICLAIITTVLSIGVLIFSKHPALKSIAVISIIGLITAMLITFSLYPVIYRFFFVNRLKKGKLPVSLRLYIISILSFIYYFIGSIFLFLFGSLYITIFPGTKAKKIFYYRKAIQLFLKSVMYSNYGVKNVLRNPYHENFEQPAIIIANHSSFLDTLSIGFLPTPLIFTVKDRVYHNPIYGKTIQLAGYYPVTNGIAQGEEKLVAEIKKGYSIIIFPEGTRSNSNEIRRFHKGAFYIAQKYNIDILPIYIHGNAALAPKNDFIIFDGKHTLEIGKRIHFTPEKQTDRLRDITKDISKKFKMHFHTLRQELEDENYFKQKIILSFLYKTWEVQKMAIQEFHTVKSFYYSLQTILPNSGTTLRIGNDLGIGDLLLTLHSPKRKIYTYIENEEFKSIAKQNIWCQKRKISYIDISLQNSADNLLITCKISRKEGLKIVEENNNIKQLILPLSCHQLITALEQRFEIVMQNNYFYQLKAK